MNLARATAVWVVGWRSRRSRSHSAALGWLLACLLVALCLQPRAVFADEHAPVGVGNPSAASGPEIGRRYAGNRPIRLASAVPPGGFRYGHDLGKGKFLVASRKLRDPNFAQSVVLLVEFGEQGAMGLVVNRPTDVTLAKVLPEIEGIGKQAKHVYIGGPVARDHILLLIRSGEPLQETVHVFGDIYVSGSEDVLRKVVEQSSLDQDFHAYAGHAGWAAGQLEAELSRGDWHVSAAETDMLFTMDPAEIWPELIRRNSGIWVKVGARRSTPPSSLQHDGVAVPTSMASLTRQD